MKNELTLKILKQWLEAEEDKLIVRDDKIKFADAESMALRAQQNISKSNIEEINKEINKLRRE